MKLLENSSNIIEFIIFLKCDEEKVYYFLSRVHSLSISYFEASFGRVIFIKFSNIFHFKFFFSY